MAVEEKYARLYERLVQAASNESRILALPIAEVDELVGGLPPAAWRRKQWWTASGTAQARAWTEAGWRVEVVGVGQQRVAFARQ